MRLRTCLATATLAATLITASPVVADDTTPTWLERLKRTEFSIPLVDGEKPSFSILTVQPLYSRGNNFIFNQSRVAYDGDERTTINLGFGYRRLSASEKYIYGINYFFDYERPYDHARSGVGLEFKAAAFEINGNVYLPHSQWRAAGTGFEERALRGFDAEVGGQVPYVPWAWVFAKGFAYESEIDGIDDITGTEYALRLRPLNFIEIEGGLNDSTGSDSTHFVRLSYRYGFGEAAPAKKRSLFSSTPFETEVSMRDRVYDKVRRSNDITVQRRATGDDDDMDGATATVRVAVGS